MRSFVKCAVPVVCAGVLWWTAKEEHIFSTDSKKEKLNALKAISETGAEKKEREYQDIRVEKRQPKEEPIFSTDSKKKKLNALKAISETGAEKKELEYQDIRVEKRMLPLLSVHGQVKGFDNCDKVSCYANSAVQCLFSIHDNLFNVLRQLRGPISEEIEKLAFSSLEKTESTKQLRKLFPSEYGFADSVHQCMTEFWETLFECVDNENRPNSANQMSYRSPLTEIFHFENRKYLVCDICQWSEIEDDQTCRKLLYLAVPESHERCILFNRVLNPYYGRNCPNGHELTSRIVFTKTSPFLAVALNRNLSGFKNNASIVNIDFDSINLEVAKDNRAKDSCYHDLLLSSVNYKAVAIAVHLGSVDAGHYLVYRRTPNCGWYRCNDSEVKEVDFNDINTIDQHLVQQMTFLVLEKC
ncbi:uncharacterized protein LOC136038431 [Artemia franciscana]|uniref:uncharacterized protein LOC136038431 n=1 Tax=Artemia franciscana TaxID=6661 RepID=UPI0032DADB8A